MIAVFLSQFVLIYTMGLQSLMVRDNNFIGAMLGSLLIGINSFYLYGRVAEIGVDSIGSPLYFAFITAGPLAIACAMKTHPLLHKHVFRRKTCLSE